MYKIGDKVVYPVHGAGEVVAIEQREVAGRLREYYILNLPYSGLKIAVPQGEAGRLGLRRLMSAREIERVWLIVSGEENVARLPKKWSFRAKLLQDKIKAGDVCELAGVVVSLKQRERQLAGGERRLFEQARDILLSELKLAQSEQAASGDIEKILAKLGE